MCKTSECLQLQIEGISNIPTPCFRALGLEVCDLPYCAVSEFLRKKNIEPHAKDRYSVSVIKYGLHNVCPQSIHNHELTQDKQNVLVIGLREIINNHR